MTEPLRLPVGIDDFEKIRKSDFYYVDKTKLIESVEGLTYDMAMN